MVGNQYIVCHASSNAVSIVGFLFQFDIVCLFMPFIVMEVKTQAVIQSRINVSTTSVLVRGINMDGTEKQIKLANEIISKAKVSLESEWDELNLEKEKIDKNLEYSWKIVSDEVKDIIDSDRAVYVIEKRDVCTGLKSRALDYYSVITEARKQFSEGEITKDSLESASRFHSEMLEAVVNCELRDVVKRKIKNCELALWAVDNP